MAQATILSRLAFDADDPDTDPNLGWKNRCSIRTLDGNPRPPLAATEHALRAPRSAV
jgi:hypothetical protein